VTALYVTHDQDEAAVVADHIGVMRDGCLISQGDPQSVLALPLDPWVASFLGTVPPFEGVVAAVDNGVARIDCSGVQVQAVTSLPLGTEVVVGIRPEDVLIFERDVELLKTSARNRIEGRVAELSPAGVTVNVLIELGGIQVASAVSRASAESLALTPGAPVTAVFKATAVRVAER
jgi:molybdopterin-binding protein